MESRKMVVRNLFVGQQRTEMRCMDTAAREGGEGEKHAVVSQ